MNEVLIAAKVGLMLLAFVIGVFGMASWTVAGKPSPSGFICILIAIASAYYAGTLG